MDVKEYMSIEDDISRAMMLADLLSSMNEDNTAQSDTIVMAGTDIYCCLDRIRAFYLEAVIKLKG